MNISLDVKRGGGGTLIISYIRRLWQLFGVQNFEFHIFGVLIKCIFLGGMNILWLSFWGYNKIGLDLEVISMHFNVKVQNG